MFDQTCSSVLPASSFCVVHVRPMLRALFPCKARSEPESISPLLCCVVGRARPSTQ